MSKDKQVIRELQGRIRGLERGSKSRGSQLIRAASMPVTSSDSDTTSSDGASCGCCDPTNCAHYLQPLANDDDCPEGPFGWEVNFGNSITLGQLCQNLTKDSEGNFELSYVGYGVWRSESFTCNGTAQIGGCNSESAGCCGGQTDTYDFESGSYVLQGETNCTGTCVSGAPAVESDYGPIEQPCRPTTGDTSEYAFVSLDGSTWSLTASACATTPPDPPRAPLFEGDVYTNNCCNDALSVADAGEGTQYAWIQLTTDNTRDADGRSNTKLELIVGGVAAFTFRPRIGFDWCCSCENKMELQCCGPFAFQFIPESVCVKPMGPGDFEDKYVDAPGGWSCCETITVNDEPKLPKYITVTISAANDYCVNGCCEEMNGTYLLEFGVIAINGWYHKILDGCFLETECNTDADAGCDRLSLGPRTALESMRVECIEQGGFRFFMLTIYLWNYSRYEIPECEDAELPENCGTLQCWNSELKSISVYSQPISSNDNCFEHPIVFDGELTPEDQICTLLGSSMGAVL